MLTTPAIESFVDARYRELLLAQPRLAGALRQYRGEGGAADGNPGWATRGLYVHLKKGRLVLEAFHSRGHDGLVVRVYTESPLRFFHARKVRHDLQRCGELIGEAVQHFQLHLPDELIPAGRFDPPAGLEHLEPVMVPVPPPLSSCEVPD